MLLVKLSLVSLTHGRGLMTQYSNKKEGTLYIMLCDMQKIGTEMCKPECRAWRKHVDKNKERNRRDLSTQRLGQNQLLYYTTKIYCCIYQTLHYATKLQTVEGWITKSLCQQCFPNSEEKMNSDVTPSRKSLQLAGCSHPTKSRRSDKCFTCLA